MSTRRNSVRNIATPVEVTRRDGLLCTERPMVLTYMFVFRQTPRMWKGVQCGSVMSIAGQLIVCLVSIQFTLFD